MLRTPLNGIRELGQRHDPDAVFLPEQNPRLTVIGSFQYGTHIKLIRDLGDALSAADFDPGFDYGLLFPPRLNKKITTKGQRSLLFF